MPLSPKGLLASEGVLCGLTLWLSEQEGVCGRGCQATGRAPGRGSGWGRRKCWVGADKSILVALRWIQASWTHIEGGDDVTGQGTLCRAAGHQ